MVRRVLIYLIQTQNIFKFDLKHGYYHIISYHRFSWKIGNVRYLVLTVFSSRTWFSLVSVWKDYSSFSKLLAQKSVKESMFLRWGPESIRIVIWSNSQFISCARNFAKILLFVNGEKPIWETQEVMTELQNSLSFEN